MKVDQNKSSNEKLQRSVEVKVESEETTQDQSCQKEVRKTWSAPEDETIPTSAEVTGYLFRD